MKVNKSLLNNAGPQRPEWGLSTRASDAGRTYEGAQPEMGAPGGFLELRNHFTLIYFIDLIFYYS